MNSIFALLVILISGAPSLAWPRTHLLGNSSINALDVINHEIDDITEEPDKLTEEVPCNCGVFLSGQFEKGTMRVVDEEPVVMMETGLVMHPCGAKGNKLCLNKCIEMMASYLPKAGPMVCGAIDRDCFKERAYLFVQNCEDTWTNTKFSAGKEFCCKDGALYKCPRGKRHVAKRHL